MSTRALYIASFAVAATLHVLLFVTDGRHEQRGQPDAGGSSQAVARAIEVNLLASPAQVPAPVLQHSIGHAEGATGEKRAMQAHAAVPVPVRVPATVAATTRAAIDPLSAHEPAGTHAAGVPSGTAAVVAKYLEERAPAAKKIPVPGNALDERTSGAYAAPLTDAPAAGATVAYTSTVSGYRPPSPEGVIDPEYPLAARNRGWEGAVVVRAAVSRSGTVIDTQVVDSSGYAILDSAALHAVARARFRPATSDSTPVASEVLVPFRFSLLQSK